MRGRIVKFWGNKKLSISTPKERSDKESRFEVKQYLESSLRLGFEVVISCAPMKLHSNFHKMKGEGVLINVFDKSNFECFSMKLKKSHVRHMAFF